MANFDIFAFPKINYNYVWNNNMYGFMVRMQMLERLQLLAVAIRLLLLYVNPGTTLLVLPAPEI